MSRLYLVILICLLSQVSLSQNLVAKYLQAGQEKMEAGDYYYATQLFSEALKLDSNSVNILWQYAESQRAYKNYKEAEKYYQIVYDKEMAEIYPSSLLYLGLMQKQNGKYLEALETFKLAKKKYSKNRSSYQYLKSKQEVESCLWAMTAIKDTVNYIAVSIPEIVNSKDAEFGHLILDNKLVFSSLRADSISTAEEVYDPNYRVSHFVYSDQTLSPIEDLSNPTVHRGNGSISPDGKRFYFSECENLANGMRCKIMVAQYSNGQWINSDSLGEIINIPGSSNTMPHSAQVDGEEWLIFASDNEDGEGGLDLFYSKVKNGNQYSKVKKIPKINTREHELTPYWDRSLNRLYYSSSWENGFGGADVYYTEYKDGQFSEPMNAGLPINSPANDLYFFKHQDTLYVSSNRVGVNYSKNPTCCSDIFSYTNPVVPPVADTLPTLRSLMARLPVTLYFHNDEPNPKTRDTITDLNYLTTYDDYQKLLGQYKKEYSKGLSGQKSTEAEEDIESFFMQYVDQGVRDLATFTPLLLEELEKGAKIELQIQGFASPLAKTDYNVNLTKRRISSFENYLRSWKGGILLPFLNNNASNGGYLKIKQIPFGEYSADQLISDNPNDQKQSVYSRAAAAERKIQILSASFINQTNQLPIVCNRSKIDFGEFNRDTPDKMGEFILLNEGEGALEIESIHVDNEACIVQGLESKTMNSEAKLQFTLKSNQLSGHFKITIELKFKGYDETYQLFVVGESKLK